MLAINDTTRDILNMAQSSLLMYRPASCLMTNGTIFPIDDDQLSQRGAPWTFIEDQDFISKVDLIAPVKVYETIRERILKRKSQPYFYRTTISLGQLLDSEQFLPLIRNQEITMFCEEGSMFASSYAIRNGILTIHTDKETFQRAGLPGKPLIAQGGSDGQDKWGISVDLSGPSSSFEGRVPDCLAYACSTVFTERLVWLFCLKTGSALNNHLWENRQPQQHSIASKVLQKILALPERLTTASSTTIDRSGLKERGIDLYEWLSLVRLESARVEPDDNIDSYLSRYHVTNETSDRLNVCKITWQGFIGTSWLRNLAHDVLATCPRHSWVSIIATSSYCVEMGINAESALLRPPGQDDQYLMWQIKRHK